MTQGCHECEKWAHTCSECRIFDLEQEIASFKQLLGRFTGANSELAQKGRDLFQALCEIKDAATGKVATLSDASSLALIEAIATDALSSDAPHSIAANIVCNILESEQSQANPKVANELRGMPNSECPARTHRSV